MKVEYFEKISELKDIWINLYNSNQKLSSFQSYEWNEILEESYLSRKNRLLNGYQTKYYVFDDKIILPLAVDKRHKEVTIMGQHDASDYLSFIFDKIELADLKYCLDFLQKNYPKYKITFDRINEKNPMQLLIDQIGYCTKQQKVCVAVDIPESDASFYDGLSRNAKQNYHKAINRISKNNLSKRIEISTKALTRAEALELYGIYRQRREDKLDFHGYKEKVHKIKKILKRVLDIEDYDSYTNYAIRHDVFLSRIYIDGKVAAFCEGLTYSEGTIYIGRLGTNREFYAYSPGQILIIETIESLRKTAKCFDLTRGEEDYKARMGGKHHYNYCYTFEKE